MNLNKISFIILTIVFIMGCKKKIDKELDPIIGNYFSKVDDCEQQRNDLKANNRLKLYYFDSKGYISEDIYANSPSYLLKKQLRNDTIFYKYTNENFDFFVFTQDCDIGITRTQQYKIRNFPTILLIDPFKNVILKKVGSLPTQFLIEEIGKTINE